MTDKDSPEVMARVHEALELVEPTARRLSRTLGPGADLDELMSCGRAAALAAARDYDPGFGHSFRTHAKHNLERAMLTGFRQMAALPRRTHEHLTVDERDESAQDSKRLRDKHLAGVAAAQAEGLLARPGLDSQGEFVAISAKTMPDEGSHKNQLRELIALSLDQLPPDEAEIIRRHFFDEVPIDRLAKELGITRMRARTLQARAQASLSKLLARMAR
jgi:RNA polymerase sigma factor FliA